MEVRRVGHVWEIELPDFYGFRGGAVDYFSRTYAPDKEDLWDDDEAESERLRQPGGDMKDFDGGSQKTYQRMIEEMDRQVGRVLQGLDTNGLTDNTIIIFTSDNGGERFADT